MVEAELLDPGAVAEPAWDENRLLTAGQGPAPGGGASLPALEDEQPGDEAKQFHGHVKRGTIGDHVESSVAKKFCGKTSSTGTPRPFPGMPALAANLPATTRLPRRLAECPFHFSEIISLDLTNRILSFGRNYEYLFEGDMGPWPS